MKIEDCRWTQLPNDFIDQGCIKIVKAAATSIYWCIARKTKGWQKETDAVSYSQLSEITGFARDTLCKALRALLDNDLIIAEKTQGKTTVYRLKLSATSPETGLHQSRNQTGTSPETGLTKEKKETSKINDPFYSQEFEEWWEVYLRKDGKIGAFRVYKTAKKKGATKEMLLMAALCYSNRCKKDDTSVKYILLPRTFLGRDMHWLEWYRNAEQIRQADEMKKTKNKAVVREQIELTPEQQKKNQEAISEILKPLNVKFGARRV